MKVTSERKIGVWVPVLLCLLLAGTVWFGFHQSQEQKRTNQLFTALYSGNPIAVRAALAQGADVNSRVPLWPPPDGPLSPIRQWLALTLHPDQTKTALTAAVASGNRECVRLLLKNGAIPNERNGDGSTPLMGVFGCYPPQQGSRVMQMLLDKGADVNAKDRQGGTALTRSLDGSLDDHLTVPRFLLAHGASVDAKSDNGNTPLQEMMLPNTDFEEKRHIPIITLLLDYGANLNVTDRLGRTPLQSASEWINPGLVSS